MSTPKLFSPGPVMVKDNVRRSLLHYDICHRSREFEVMFADTQEILRLFNADDSYYSVIVSGSGTSSNETVLSSIFKEGEAVMLIRNGMFGERLLEIINKYEIPLVDCAFDWATYPDVAVIEKMIASIFFISFSPRWASSSLTLTPGIIPSTCPSGPIP